MIQQKFTWEIKKEDIGKEIKLFLREQGISRRALSTIKYQGGKIQVNGIEKNVRHYLREFDVLDLTFPPEQENESLVKEHLPLSIIYEDKDLLLVNKPAGMSTIPSRHHPSGSLANGLAFYYEQIGLKSTIHIVTRLDRDTSGLVLIAKHRHAHHLLSKLQKHGEIERIYEAFVEGEMEHPSGQVNQPIGRKTDSIIEREVRCDGQYALTNYEVIHTFPSFTHLRLQLSTGRTHQIRVHMAFFGHPLLGDDLYGGLRDLINRQALHCKQVNFCHPFSGKNLSFQIELPADMQILLNE